MGLIRIFSLVRVESWRIGKESSAAHRARFWPSVWRRCCSSAELPHVAEGSCCHSTFELSAQWLNEKKPSKPHVKRETRCTTRRDRKPPRTKMPRPTMATRQNQPNENSRSVAGRHNRPATATLVRLRRRFATTQQAVYHGDEQKRGYRGHEQSADDGAAQRGVLQI